MQVLFRFGVAATTSPDGNVSVNERPVNPSPLFEFVIVSVKLVVPFNGIEVAPNAFAIEGGEATIRLAVAVLPVPPLVEEIAPVVFVNCPETFPVTVTAN